MPTGFEYMEYATGMKILNNRYYILNNSVREDITDKLTDETRPLRIKEKFSREAKYLLSQI